MTEAEQIALGCQGAQLTVAVLDASATEPEWNLTDAQLRAVLAARESVLDICATPPLTFAVAAPPAKLAVFWPLVMVVLTMLLPEPSTVSELLAPALPFWTPSQV